MNATEVEGVTVPGPWSDMAGVKEANREAGMFFFSRDTMLFFDSRVESEVIAGRFFLTSEQFHDGTYHAPRKFTVRVVYDSGRIGTIGGFNVWHSKAEAKEYLTLIMQEAT